MKPSKEFSDRLIDLRKKMGCSQEELGYKLDVSRQTISKWEKGDAMPETEKLINLSKVFNITIDELLYGRVETEVIEVKAEPIIGNKVERTISIEDEDYNNKTTEVLALQKVIVKRKSFIARNFIKIMLSIIVILLICYLVLCGYRFSILKEINDKFNSYKDINNCYYEKTEVMTNEVGTAYITNSKYWYKDGILKFENKKTENGKTETIYKYIDLRKKEKYMIFEDNKKVIKNINEGQVELLKEGILSYLIGKNYYESAMDIVKDAINVYQINIIKDNDNYIIENKLEIYSKKIFNRQDSIIKQNYSLNDNKEETKILHKIELDIVKDEDIEMIDLSEYEIIEQK